MSRKCTIEANLEKFSELLHESLSGEWAEENIRYSKAVSQRMRENLGTLGKDNLYGVGAVALGILDYLQKELLKSVSKP